MVGFIVEAPHIALVFANWFLFIEAFALMLNFRWSSKNDGDNDKLPVTLFALSVLSRPS